MSFLTGLGRLELAGMTPLSLQFHASQQILKVQATCSKHHREETLPMHPELVAMVFQ
jgi:hypothetical protein